MASSRRVLLRLQGDSGDARRAVNEVRSDLRRMSREEASVRLDIQTARVERSIDRVKVQLANLAKQKASPAVELKTTLANERLRLLEFRLDRLNLKKVNIDVDIRRGALERTAAGLATVERSTGGIVRGFGDAARAIPIFGQIFATVLNGAISLASSLGSALGSLVSTGIEALASSVKGLGSIGALAGPIGGIVASLIALAAQGALVAGILGGLAIALNAILGAVVALAGALVALVASLTAAVAGLGALAVAFGGVLIPVVAVAIGLFTRFAAIIKARQAREQELTTAVQAQKTAEQQRKTALDQVRSAHERLAQAVVDGRRAMAQSAIDERNAELALQNSQLGLKGARLGVLEAKKELRDLLSTAGAAGTALDRLMKQFSDVHVDPTNLQSVLSPAQNAGATGKLDPLALQRAILNVQVAQQGVKNAVNDTANAENRLSEATRKRVDFAKRGLDAYKPYRTALEAVRRAETRLSRAQDQTTAAHRKYEKALKGLSGTERESLTRLDTFIAKFKELAKVFTDPIFRAINDVFDSLAGSGDGLKTALTAVGTAFGDVIRAIGAFLKEPATQTAFQTMSRGAADLVRTLGGRGFRAFLTIMREVAVTALPAVRTAAHDVANALEGVAGKPGRIHRVVGSLVGQFKTWARLAGSLIGLVKDIFNPAAKSGQSLANSMRHTVDHWRELIRANPDKVRKFFRDAVNRTRSIFNGIKDIVRWLKNDLPAAADKAKNVFGAIYKVIKKIIDLTDKIKSIARDAADTLGIGQSPKDAQKQAENDLSIVRRDTARLKTHLDPATRSAIRKELIDTIKDIFALDKQTNVVNLTGAKQLQGLLNQLIKAQAKPPRPHNSSSPDAKAGTASVIHHHYEIKAPKGAVPDPVAAITKIHKLVVLKG